MCCSFPVRLAHQGMSLQLMRKRQEEILVDTMGSGLSPLLDGSSTVSSQRKDDDSLNSPIHVFNFYSDINVTV